MKKLLVICVLLTPSLAVALDPLVSVEVSVVDESGTPKEDVEVVGTFLGVTDFHTDTETTDENGRVVVRGRSLFPMGLVAKKDGYYTSAAEVDTIELVDGEPEYKDQTTRLVLREKKNPIPLYAKRYTGYVPVKKEWLGFDLEKSDWVTPYGNGAIADINLYYDGEFRGFNDAQGKLVLKAAGNGGIMKIEHLYLDSEFIAPYEAPAVTYSEKKIIWEEAIGQQIDPMLRPSDNNNYFMQLRVVKNKDGVIERANYAKLYGDIRFSLRSLGEGVSRVKFTYYFNPTPNDHNLEFDTGHNLFKRLKHDERVVAP